MAVKNTKYFDIDDDFERLVERLRFGNIGDPIAIEFIHP